MPYIEPQDRSKLDRDICYIVNTIIVNSKSYLSVGDTSDATVGNLNYVLTRIAVLVADNLSKNPVDYGKKKLSYALLNKIWGVLNGVAIEFYLRVLTPYEDKKVKDNGDVYTELLNTINETSK